MVAVHFAHDESLDVEAERQFRREAKLLAAVRHPHLHRVTDHYVVPGQSQFLVVDFIPGEDSQEELSSRTEPFAQAEALRWAQQILDALNCLRSPSRLEPDAQEARRGPDSTRPAFDRSDPHREQGTLNQEDH